jgi:hypothetical protein
MSRVRVAVTIRWAVFCIATVLGMPSVAAESSREVHGSADVYSAPGVALAWGVLRGADEATTTVVVRIVANADVFRRVAVVGSDPFSDRKRTLLAATSIDGGVEVRSSRQAFGDFPRTEFRFYATASTAALDPPQLVVYFLGVPDTTPEFAAADALDRYLTGHLERVRATKGVP